MLIIPKIHAAIEAFVKTSPPESYLVDIPSQSSNKRNYLGLSSLGAECPLQVWLQWRKAYKSSFDGRMLRLFRRGDLEEYRFNFLLRGIGFTVFDKDADGKQFRVKDFADHLSGSMDGVGKAPVEFWNKGTTPIPFLLEYKSYNDKRFGKLVAEGVESSDIKYFTQCIGYMGYNDLEGCLFCAVNKNNDELHFEWIPFEPNKFSRLVDNAQDILEAEEPPPRISHNPGWWKCKFCDAKAVCHGKKPPLKRCRTCKFAKPAEAGTWECTAGEKFGKVCGQYESIMS